MIMLRSMDERGFSLIEVAICVLIITIAAIGTYNIIIYGNRHIADSRRMTEATNIARAMLEKLADDPASTDFYPSDMERLPNMSWQIEYLNSYGETVPDFEIEIADPLTIKLTISWRQDQDSRQRSVQLSTRITQGLT